MTTRMPPRRGRWIAIGAALLTCTCLVTCVAPLTIQNTLWAPPDLFTTLHRSTFSHAKNSSDETAMLFADGTRALVADNIWKNRRLFFVNLAAGSRDELDLPQQGSLNVSMLIYGGDVAYALYQGADNQSRAFRVTAAGAIDELSVLDYTALMLGQEPRDAAAVELALAGGELDGVRGMAKEHCVWDTTKERYRVAAVQRLRYFANDRYLVISNDEAMSARLEQLSGPLIHDRCAARLPLDHGRYRLELVRSDVGMGGGMSALDGRIQTATLLRDGEVVQRFTFTQPDAWYYYTAWIDNQLYFVGASVRYVDLDTMP